MNDKFKCRINSEIIEIAGFYPNDNNLFSFLYMLTLSMSSVKRFLLAMVHFSNVASSANLVKIKSMVKIPTFNM